MSDASKAVFLSYASQDAEAALRIAKALRAVGIEVWFDQNELVGGDAWDQKIRRQIKECALFVPVISAATQARGEGYFRLEWKLAVDRSHLMAPDQPFLLPVVIDNTPDAAARVADEFRAVQWTRLPAGETTPAFCARVKKLLSGEAPDAGRGRRTASDSETATFGDAAPQQKKTPASRPWLVPAIIFGAAAGIALTLWQPWRAKETVAPASPLSVSAPAKPLTEAQQLVVKARKIFEEGDEMNRETYLLTEDLLKKAEALDVTEASAWALHAGASSQGYLFGLDASPSRREAMLSQAARAEKLAPGSVEAVVARAQVRIALRQDLAGLQRELEKFAEAHPTDVSLLRALGQSYGLGGKTEESLQSVRRALQQAPDDPRLKADLINSLRVANRLGEAEAAVKEALKGRASGRLLVVDVIIKMIWRGDAPAAAAAAQSWPSWLLLEDRGAAWAALACSWNKEPAKALEILRNFPRDEFRDIFLGGPRAAFSALAHEQAGQEESARADWRAALQVAERSLAVSADDLVALHWKAWALFRLGDSGSAATAFNLLREKTATGPGGLYTFGGLAGLALTAGRTEDALVCLQNMQTVLMAGSRNERPLTKAMLRANPVFDPLRGDPRFQALIDAAPGPEEKKENASAGAVALDPKSVAVLAFANMSADKDNEYFSDGLSENILDKLARNSGLRVMARTSSFSYKGKNLPVQQIGQELRVGTVIEGSVQRAGNRLRITAQLINATDGSHVWSEQFDRDLTTADIFAVQDEIALKIAARLAPNSTAPSTAAAKLPTQNLAAYEAYLRGRSIEAPGYPQQRLQAMPYYEEAVRLDPGFALAWARIAYTMGWIYTGGGLSGDELTRGQQALDTAMRLQPDLPEVHLARSVILRANYMNLREAAREIALAESRRPENADILYERALVERFSGHLEEALALSRRAADRDPLNANILNNMGIILRFLGRYEESLAMLDQSLKVSASGFPRSNRAATIVRAGSDPRQAVREFDGIPRDQFDAVIRVMKVSTLEAAGLYAEALAEINMIEPPTFMQQYGFGIRSLHAARAQEMMGDASGARQSYEQALPLALAYQKQQPQLARAWSALALVYAGLGKKEEAFDAIQAGLKILPPAESPYYATEILLPVWVEVQARFGMIDGALGVVREQIAAGWWRRNDLLLKPEFFVIRRDPRFREIAEKAPL